MDDVIGVILAGGKSSRMGINKAELVYNNRSLLEHAKQLFKDAGIKKVYISGNGGIEDIIANRGPLGGIYSVMRHLPDNQEIIIAPVDMPLLSQDILNILFTQGCSGEAVHFDNFIMPLKLRLSLSVKKQIEKIILVETQSLSVKSMLNNLNVEVVNLSSAQERCFVNINTPEEWGQIQ